MKQLQYVYPLSPDKCERYFIDSEIANLLQQFIDRPQIFISDELCVELGVSIDTTVPIGIVERLAVVPTKDKNGIAFIFQIEDHIIDLCNTKNILSDIKLEPYIIGLVTVLENKIFIDNAKLTNLILTV